jgi:Cyclic nucleotide-binding domain.
MSHVSHISMETWFEIAHHLEEKSFRKGEYFAVVGRREHHFGIVLEGIFRAYITNGKGVDYTKTLFTPIFFKTPISFIGAYSSLISSTVNHVNIQALTSARILYGKYDDWLSLINRNKEVSDWSRKLAELFFAGKEKREFEYLTMQAEERYILFREQYPEVENSISQYYIAQFLGITPTQLSRIRKKIFSEK